MTNAESGRAEAQAGAGAFSGGQALRREPCFPEWDHVGPAISVFPDERLTERLDVPPGVDRVQMCLGRGSGGSPGVPLVLLWGCSAHSSPFPSCKEPGLWIRGHHQPLVCPREGPRPWTSAAAGGAAVWSPCLHPVSGWARVAARGRRQGHCRAQSTCLSGHHPFPSCLDRRTGC